MTTELLRSSAPPPLLPTSLGRGDPVSSVTRRPPAFICPCVAWALCGVRLWIAMPICWRPGCLASPGRLVLPQLASARLIAMPTVITGATRTPRQSSTSDVLAAPQASVLVLSHRHAACVALAVVFQATAQCATGR